MVDWFVDSLKTFNTILENYSNVIDALIILSILVAFITLKKDHTRSRRENSVELIIKWGESLNKRTGLAKKYVEQLSKNQIKHLKNFEEIEFNPNVKDERELYNKIKELLSENDANIDMTVNEHTNIEENKVSESDGVLNQDELKLTRRESNELRWLVINYLNMLEAILTAWQHNAADRKIIEQEFRYMFDLAEGKDILKELRVACGSEKCYPAIEKFYARLERERRKALGKNSMKL